MEATNKTSVVGDVPVIPGYELLGPIGEGSMGAVYRAHQLESSRLVAIKFLHRLPSDQSAILNKRYQRESQLMASLSHPNVVAMYDCGKRFGSFYLIMELVSGVNLRSLMKTGVPWPPAQAAPIVEAVTQALTYIHGQGILHLDLKPENILRAELDGAIKITDFGLSLLQIDARLVAESGGAQGTIDYCAPEQRFGLRVDVRSDLFSLATITYELLTGRLPGRVYFPCAHAYPHIPERVDAVLKRGLARDPDERYANVAAFKTELMAALRI